MLSGARFIVMFGVFAVASFLPGASAQIDWPELTFTPVATGATFPVHVTHSGDGSGRMFVVEQPGRILVTTSNGFAAAPFLDLSTRVSFEFSTEDGLLNLAFPPNFAASQKFYVYYTRTGDLASVLARFSVTTNANIADPASEEQILIIPEVTERTLNGGMLAFGPDGYLYVGTGDNGFDFNAVSLAQNPASLWGKILRLDVTNSPTGYVVPQGNPFVGNPGYAPEVWALGLRNPWRFSFDRANGDLYISDVGQFIAEEINYDPAPGAAGRNYGWQTREGRHSFFPSFNGLSQFTDPIFEVLHPSANDPQAIVGGYVYRGPARPRMNGMYFFADAYRGLIQGLVRSNGVWHSAPVLQTPYFLTGFGEDQAGNLYVIDYISGDLSQLDDSLRARTPVFSPSGPDSNTDLIEVTSLTPGAVLRYTTTGIDPDELSPVVVGGTVTITSGTTLKARAFRTNQQPSIVSSMTYSLRAARPLFSPSQGPVTNIAPITITTVTPGVSIRYTLDGSDPDGSAQLYSSPVILATNQVLRARAFREGFADSDVASFHSVPLQMQMPAFSRLDAYSGRTVLTWSSITGQTYRVQYSSDFTYWLDASTNILATGSKMSLTNFRILPNPQYGFYRVIVP